MSIITFKPLSKSHLDLLLTWLETSHVKAWWDQDVKWTMKLVEEKYGHYIKGYKKLQGKEKIIKKRMWAFTIFFEEIPIGYIQYYNVHDFPREQGDDISELPISCAGLDWYIGEVEFTGKGIGTKALSDFLHQYVFPSFKNVFVDPDTANVGAIRVYAKTGFAVVKKVNHGKITWMLCERD